MPPEVLKSSVAVLQSDIYQMSVLFYRALNGEEIFEKQLSGYATDSELRHAILKGRFPNRDEFLPHIPKSLRTLVRKAMRVDPFDRFDTATALADALGRARLDRDWSVQLKPTGETTWESNSGNTCPLRVELKISSKGWVTEVYTSGSSLRAKGKDELWGRFPNRKQAMEHLKWVFEQL